MERSLLRHTASYDESLTDFLLPVGVLNAFSVGHSNSSYGCPKGLKAQGFNCDGYLQEYIVVDARSAARLPPNLDVARSAPLCCAGVTAFNAIKECFPELGKWLAVFGAGGVGKMAIQYAKAKGFKVVAVDINKDQLEDAERVGADETFMPSDLSPDRVAMFREKTRGGVDAAVNFTSSSQSYTDMQGLIKFNGILMVVGIADELKVKPMDISFRKLVIKGASNGTAQDLKECFEFSAKHDIKTPHKFIELQNVPQVVDEMNSGMVRERTIIVF
ncbi:hypothetical protein FGRA07_11737 [Fusarium graminearum]|nr:hypothetical protein FGRA07_11737 [Fusarium graminearum]